MIPGIERIFFLANTEILATLIPGQDEPKRKHPSGGGDLI